MSLPTRVYIPTIAKAITHLCKLITKHRPLIMAAVAVISIGDVAAANAALDALTTMCALWQRLETLLNEES